jgi:hypothetical protein
LKQLPSVRAIKSQIKDSVAKDPAEAKLKMEAGEISSLYSLTDKKDIQDMLSTWVHEMGHMLEECKHHLIQHVIWV